jgi:hypothetical protein
MTDSTNKPSALFWVIAIIALIWNGLGVMAYLTRAFITEEMIATLPKEQQAEFLVENPAWVTAAFALAVFGGVLGAIFLLLKKKAATTLFIISAISAIVQHIYIFMNVEVSSYVMPIMVIVVCIFLVMYSKKSTEKGWLS